jgi:hypothetical protein
MGNSRLGRTFSSECHRAVFRAPYCLLSLLTTWRCRKGKMNKKQKRGISYKGWFFISLVVFGYLSYKGWFFPGSRGFCELKLVFAFIFYLYTLKMFIFSKFHTYSFKHKIRHRETQMSSFSKNGPNKP